MTINFELAEKAKELVGEAFGRFNPKVKERLQNIKFEIATATSHFDRKDTVYINYRSINDLSVYVHELLHVLGTSNSFNKQYIGLHKRYSRKIGDDLFVQTSMGYAINEGATECYTRDIVYGKYPKAPAETNYNFCSNIYRNLENVLASTNLKIIYANGNIDNFIKAVAFNAHTSQENVIKLILNLDAYFDTYRIFNAFLYNPNSVDVKHLLTNCYTYLAAILSDYAKSRGKVFDVWSGISRDCLNKDELVLFAEILQNVDLRKAKGDSLATLKLYDRMSMYLLTKQLERNLENFNMLPNYLKCGEFYNFLLLNTEFCDSNGVAYDIKTKDEKAKLTQKLFDGKYNALIVDKYLPQHVITMLAARYAIRANTATSDYYMEICMNSNSFREFIKASDPDYCEALCELVKNKKEQSQTEEEHSEDTTNEWNKE